MASKPLCEVMTVMDAWLSGHLRIYFSLKVFSVVFIISVFVCLYKEDSWCDE